VRRFGTRRRHEGKNQWIYDPPKAETVNGEEVLLNKYLDSFSPCF